MSANPKIVNLPEYYYDREADNRPVRRSAASLPLIGALVAGVTVAVAVYALLARQKGKATPRPSRKPAAPTPDTDHARREQQRLIDESRKVIEKTRRIERENREAVHGR